MAGNQKSESTPDNDNTHFIPLGLVSSSNLSADGTTHSALAQTALDSDDIYCAYYHAESAREAGEPPQEYAGSLITALGILDILRRQASN